MHKNWNIASVQNIWAFNFISITIIIISTLDIAVMSIILGKRCWSWPFCLLRNSRRWWQKKLFGQPWDGEKSYQRIPFQKMTNTESHLWPWLEKMRARSGGIKSTILQRNGCHFSFQTVIECGFGRICPWSPYQHRHAVTFIPRIQGGVVDLHSS